MSRSDAGSADRDGAAPAPRRPPRPRSRSRAASRAFRAPPGHRGRDRVLRRHGVRGGPRSGPARSRSSWRSARGCWPSSGLGAGVPVSAPGRRTARVGARRIQRTATADGLRVGSVGTDRRDPVRRAQFTPVRRPQQQDPLGVPCFNAPRRSKRRSLAADPRAADDRDQTRRHTGDARRDRRSWTLDHRSSCGGMLAPHPPLVGVDRSAGPAVQPARLRVGRRRPHLHPQSSLSSVIGRSRTRRPVAL